MIYETNKQKIETFFTENLHSCASSSAADIEPLKETEEVEIEEQIRKGWLEEGAQIKEDLQERGGFEQNVTYNRQWGHLIRSVFVLASSKRQNWKTQVANRIQKLYEKKSICDVQVGFISGTQYRFNM